MLLFGKGNTANLYSHLEYNAKVISAETIARMLDSENTSQNNAPAKPEKFEKKATVKKSSSRKTADNKSVKATTDKSAPAKRGRKKKSDAPADTEKSLPIAEKRCTLFNFGHKNSGQRFCYETPSAIVHYLSTIFVQMSTGFLPTNQVSTNFLPTLKVIDFYQVSTQNLHFGCFSEKAQLSSYLRFYHQKCRF